MSSQRTLQTFDAAPGQDERRPSDWTPTGQPQCVCGTRVESEVARVVGVDGVVPACPACYLNADKQRHYETVTSAAFAHQDGNGQRRSDVEIDASLHPEVDR